MYVYEKRVVVAVPDAPADADADVAKPKKPHPPKVVVNEPKMFRK